MDYQQKRQIKIDEFVNRYGMSFMKDFRTYSFADIKEKYQITYDFYRVLMTYFSIEQDKQAVEARRAAKASKTNRLHGNAQRKATNQARYNCSTPFTREDVRKKSAAAAAKSKLQKKEVRLNEFIALYKEQFIKDFADNSVEALAKKYSIGRPFCDEVRKRLGLSKDRHEISMKGAARRKELANDLEFTKQVSQKISAGAKKVKAIRTEDFIAEHLDEFISDFPTFTVKEILDKYDISESFYYLSDILELEQDKEAINKKMSEHHSVAMLSGGTEKVKQTMLERYGVTNSFNIPSVREKSIVAATTPEARQKHAATLASRYGTTCPLLINPTFATMSKLNRRFAGRLAEYGIKVEFEKKLLSYSYDLAVGKHLIEINPSISHSYDFSFGELIGRFLGEPHERLYHYKKWKVAKENGYELLSLFDWINEDNFIDFLVSKLAVNQVKLMARKLHCVEITKQQANEFLDKNHLLGACSGNSVNLALTDSSKIYSVMTFGNSRFNKDFDYELLRFATLKGFNISGGASKLFTNFVRNHEGASIITYSDNNFGNGSVYSKLGFQEIGQTGPSDMWCDARSKIAIKDLSLIRRGADILFPTYFENYFSVGLSRDDFIARGGDKEYAKEFEQHKDDKDWWPKNQDIARHYGLFRVADCGATIWRYSRNGLEAEATR